MWIIFSWTLLPWYDSNYVSLNAIKSEKGVKSMAKKDSKVLRGLIYKCLTYLDQKPKPAPNKGLMLEKMYRIESALDIAINNTYSTKNKLRERGYWQWIKKDISKMNGNEEDIKITDEGVNDGDDDKNESNVDWTDFPCYITTN